MRAHHKNIFLTEDNHARTRDDRRKHVFSVAKKSSLACVFSRVVFFPVIHARFWTFEEKFSFRACCDILFNLCVCVVVDCGFFGVRAQSLCCVFCYFKEQGTMKEKALHFVVLGDILLCAICVEQRKLDKKKGVAH